MSRDNVQESQESRDWPCEDLVQDVSQPELLEDKKAFSGWLPAILWNGRAYKPRASAAYNS